MRTRRAPAGAMTVSAVTFAAVAACGRLNFDLLPAPPPGGAPEADAPPVPPVQDAFPDAGDGAAVPPQLPDARFDATTEGDAPNDTGVGDSRADGADASIPLGNFCEEVPSLPMAPSIDGVVEAGLTLRRPAPIAWTGAQPIPATHDAAYALAWLPDALYAFVKVRVAAVMAAAPGEAVHCGDSVELYVDADGTFPDSPSYDVPGTMQFVVGAPANGTDPIRRAQLWNNVSQLQGDWTSTEFVAVPTPEGYAVEALIRAADLDLASWTLAADALVGLSLAINLTAPQDAGADADVSCPNRIGQYFTGFDAASALGCGGGPFCTTEAFCAAPLLAE